MESFFWDETGRLRTAWRFLLFGFGYVFLQIVLAILGAVGLIVYFVVSERESNGIFTDLYAVDSWAIPLQIILCGPLTLATFGLIYLFRRFVDKRTMASLGLVRPDTGIIVCCSTGVLSGAVPIACAIGLIMLLNGFQWTGFSSSWQTALLIPTFVVMAFYEEILCRGYLLQNLIDIQRPWLGVIFSSLVFWILHGLNRAAWSSPIIPLNLFGAGVVLALAYRASGNIWFPTAMHFGWNFAQGVVFEIPVSGIRTDGCIDLQVVAESSQWLTGGDFGAEGSIFITLAEVVLSLALLYWLSLRQRTASAESIFLPTIDSPGGVFGESASESPGNSPGSVSTEI